MFEFLRNSSTKKFVSTAVSLVFLLGQQPYALYASGVSTVYTDDSAKLVVDCTEITTEDAQDKGGKMGEFVKESTLGCKKSLATVSVATKADSGTVSAGLFLLGTDGADAFGKNSSTRYEMGAKDITVTGLPKVTAVKSKTGVGAEMAIREVKIRHSTMATETTGTYTFGAYAYVSALVPTDGGVGYDDIESVELDWSGVSASGTYKFTDPSTNEVVTRTFTFTGNGTSTISGDDLTFTTKTNTTTGHCAKTASDDYDCVYADGVKIILKLAEVENVDGPLSCAGIKDFVDKNPDMKDRFVCKKGEEVIECSDIELDQEEVVCKNDVQQIVDCTEVINKNACYKSGQVAEDYGYTCWRSGAQISCTDLGFDGTCPTVCKINDEEVSCDEVRNKNACVDYNIYTEKLGYTCEVGGKSVSCVTLGKGTCDLEVTCLYGEEEISCNRYKNAVKCSEQYSFDISPRYWCKRGNVQVSCENLTAATSCDLTPLVCKDKNDASEISCDIIKNYNECSKYGETADDFMQYGCEFDEITVDCSILPPDASSVCPLPKECDLVESLGYNKKLECSAMEDALKCQADGWGNYYQYYTCKIGRTEIYCNTDLTLGTCDLNICKEQCEYLGVSLDGKEDTCQCLPAPICDGVPSAQTGTTTCAYGGTPKGQGSQDCVCKAQPNCKELCTYGGVAKADGTHQCSCYEEPSCSGTISSQTGSNKCIYGGTPKADGTQACACNEVPDCTAVCPYGGTAKANGTTECSCNTEPVCSGTLSNQTGSNKCPYGGTPSADGSMSCTCNEAPNCAQSCPYGGSPKANGSEDCSCNSAPVCSGAIASQTGTNTCTYGGSPSGDGTQSCVCNAAPDCATLCTYGGTPKANGLNGCNCFVPKNCSDASICAYGGTNNSDGSCTCNEEPLCNIAEVCSYGGTAKADGTQDCSCNSAPVCTGTSSTQSGMNFCTYGGTAKANGTNACTCNSAPDCSTVCNYGGTPKADGTDTCTCNIAPVCIGDLSSQTGTNTCVYGGTAIGNGTLACACNDVPDCDVLCEYGGEPKGNGFEGCECETVQRNECLITQETVMGDAYERTCTVDYSPIFETNTTFSCEKQNYKETTTTVSTAIVPSFTYTTTVLCYEGQIAPTEHECQVLNIENSNEREEYACTRPIYKTTSQKKCRRVLNVQATSTCTPGTEVSVTAWDNGMLSEDDVSGADYVKLSYRCNASSSPIIYVSTYVGSQILEFKSGDSIIESAFFPDGNTLYFYGSQSCDGTNCTAKVTMEVYMGKDDSKLYFGDVTATLNFTKFSLTSEKREWGETCE